MKDGSPDRAHELTLDLPAAHSAVRVARNVVRHFARLQGVKDNDVEYLLTPTHEPLDRVLLTFLAARRAAARGS